MPNPGFSALESSRNICLAILASSQNPDGTPYALSTTSGPGAPSTVNGPDAPGAASTQNPVQVAGIDEAGLVRELRTDPYGSLITGIERKLLDYDVRTDTNPVYVGTNSQAALIADTTWRVQKLFYDVSNRLIDSQIITGSWSGRAALAWRSAGGN